MASIAQPRKIKIYIILGLICLCAFPVSANAYEAEMHYGWTYYLALQVGFTERQAYQIASAADSIDWDDHTNPVASPLSTPVDTIYGGERFRYFDKELNEIWHKLSIELRKSGALFEPETEAFSTLQKLRKTNREHYLNGPNKKLWDLWREYYYALVARNPAVRTWLQIHAFQPIILQRPSQNLTAIGDFSIEDSEIEIIDLTNAGHYFFRNARNFSLASTKLPTPDRNPGADKNGLFGFADSIVNYNFVKISSLCNTAKTLASCIKKYCTDLDKLIEDSNLLAKPIQVFSPRNVACEKRINTDPLYKWLRQVKKETEGAVGKAYEKQLELGTFTNAYSAAEYQKAIQANIDSMLLVEREFRDLLAPILDIQLNTKMSAPKIFDAMVRDIDQSVVDLYFHPRDPRDNAALKHATIAVNAVRGEVVRQLTELWHTDRNPGPLLHYIQDLQPHGSYNTYHGHAMVNHVPDFIIYDLDNAERATIDTIMILCEFKEAMDNNFSAAKPVDNKAKKNENPKKFFSSQLQQRSWLCEAAELDRKLDDGTSLNLKSAIRKQLDETADASLTLLTILEDVGSQSVVPDVQFSHVTQQLIEIQLKSLIDNPPHQLAKNSTVGLPDLELGLNKLDEYISSQYIPLWRDNYVDLDSNLTNYLSMSHRDLHPPDLRGRYKTKRSTLPHGFLQYDFDYCGRVLIADRGSSAKGLPTWRVDPNTGKPTPNLKAVTPCIQTKAENADNIETDIAVNDIYSVEKIEININSIKIKSNYSGELSYTISGALPKLNGKESLEMSLPRIMKSGPIEQIWHGPLREGSDMYKTKAVPPIGPGYLPVYENCQVIVTNTQEGIRELNDIADGNNQDSYSSSKTVMEYLLGNRKEHIVYRGLVNSRVNKINTDEEMTINAKLSLSTYDKPATNDPAYLACVIHARGLAPVVALSRASYQVTANASNTQKGTTSSSP